MYPAPHGKPCLEKTFAHACSQQHYSQQPGGRTDPDAHGRGWVNPGDPRTRGPLCGSRKGRRARAQHAGTVGASEAEGARPWRVSTRDPTAISAAWRRGGREQGLGGGGALCMARSPHSARREGLVLGFCTGSPLSCMWKRGAMVSVCFAVLEY